MSIPQKEFTQIITKFTSTLNSFDVMTCFPHLVSVYQQACLLSLVSIALSERTNFYHCLHASHLPLPQHPDNTVNIISQIPDTSFRLCLRFA